MKESLKLALEALEYHTAQTRPIEQTNEAITAIKEALREHAMYEVQRLGQEIQPEQEPVAIVAEVHMSRYTIEWTNGPLPEGTKLYTTPPQRTWVGLTDEDCENMNIGEKVVAFWTERILRKRNENSSSP